MAKKHLGEIVSNKKAYYDYEILESFEAGIALLGTEIKSLRGHGGSLQDSYVDILKDEAYLKNASIAPYKYGNIHNHAEKRVRKLLLHKKEIKKIKIALQEKGLTVVPLSLFFSEKGLVKLKIALARGKKLYDKREAIKEREQKKSINRILKDNI